MNKHNKTSSTKPHYHRSDNNKNSKSKKDEGHKKQNQSFNKKTGLKTASSDSPMQHRETSKDQNNSQTPASKNNNRRQNWNKRSRSQNRPPVKPIKPSNRIYNSKEKQDELVEEVEKGLVCPICEKPIRNIAMAIQQKESGKLAHFDCVLKQIHTQYHSRMSRNRRIYYIGAGNFALVKEQYDKKGHLKSYRVLEKFEYENSDE